MKLIVIDDDGILLDSVEVSREDIVAEVDRNPHGLLSELSLGAQP